MEVILILEAAEISEKRALKLGGHVTNKATPSFEAPGVQPSL